MNRYYSNTVATKYDRLRSWHDAVPKRLAEIADLSLSSLILDIGCGTGNLAQAIKSICSCECIGLDLSSEMIRVANRKIPNAGFVQADCTQIPFHCNCFDAVIGLFFIHHIAPGLRQVVISECHRVLSTGYFAIVTRSHAQIETCQYSKFFPEVVDVDKARFPQI